MTSILSSAKGKIFAALFAVAAAIALTVAVTPASAYAATITVYDGDSTVAGTIDTTSISKSPNKVYGQFYKDGIWNVVAGTQYVTVDAAIASVFGEDWDETASYITFQTTDFPTLYSKYNGGVFDVDSMVDPLNFYGATQSGSSLPLPTTSVTSYNAVLAFSWAATPQSNDDAFTTGSGLSCSNYTYPRLIWGFSNPNPTAVGGNRFPANVTAIHVY